MSQPADPFAEALGLHRAGRLAEAAALLSRSLATAPARPDSWNLLGATLARQKRFPEAEGAYRKALALQEDHEGALNNLAVLLRQSGRLAEAQAAYELTLRLHPNHANAWNNLGALLSAKGDYEGTVRCYRRVLELDPNYGYALGAAANAMGMVCDWGGRAAPVARLAPAIAAGQPVCTPFVLLALMDDPALQLACARIWNREQAVQAEPAPGWPPHERLRIAYASADLREHPVGLQIAELIERHDRDRFEWFGVYFGPRVPDDATHRRLRAAFDSFLDIGRVPDPEAVRRLRALEIDILVDLSGHTWEGRPGLVARRAAPLQASWLGYPGTSGAPWIDYLIADRFLIPPSERPHYSERILYLPDTFWVGDSRMPVAAPTPSRAELGLPEQGFVFCCFNHNYKLNPTLLDCWAGILREVQGSALWLLAASPQVEGRLRQEAAARGVDPGRLVFARRVGLAEHLARQTRADLFLDTLPFNAITTASSALHAGLPVLTCAGRAFAARGAGSLLRALGLSELIATDLDAYARRAVELALKPDRLAAVKSALAERRRAGPLFDAVRQARHLERGYLAIWERHRRGEPPADMSPSPAGAPQGPALTLP
jgi:predicted O-linked N-acetylglucosamine transferase (SPINDLY family)